MSSNVYNIFIFFISLFHKSIYQIYLPLDYKLNIDKNGDKFEEVLNSAHTEKICSWRIIE